MDRALRAGRSECWWGEHRAFVPGAQLLEEFKQRTWKNEANIKSRKNGTLSAQQQE